MFKNVLHSVTIHHFGGTKFQVIFTIQFELHYIMINNSDSINLIKYYFFD